MSITPKKGMISGLASTNNNGSRPDSKPGRKSETFGCNRKNEDQVVTII